MDFWGFVSLVAFAVAAGIIVYSLRKDVYGE